MTEKTGGLLKVKKSSARKHPQSEALKAEVAKDDDPLVRLNVELPKGKRAKLKARAALDGKTIHEIINDLVDRYLSGDITLDE